MQTVRHATLAALLLVTRHAGATDVVPIAWNSSGAFQQALTVPAGKFAEVCGPLPAESAVAWTFEADAPLDFNIHYHQGQQVQYPARLSQARKAADTLRARAPQDYCWMWSNKSGHEARLTLSLQRQ